MTFQIAAWQQGLLEVIDSVLPNVLEVIDSVLPNVNGPRPDSNTVQFVINEINRRVENGEFDDVPDNIKSLALNDGSGVISSGLAEFKLR